MTRDELLAASREPNVQAFLRVIRACEGTASDDGYRTLFGGAKFDSYADHPRRTVTVKPGLISTAAGRYQILKRNFDHYRRTLRLPDFSPESQDAIAVQMIRECNAAVADINSGYVESAIRKCRSRWASLPGAGYDQPEKKMAELLAAYQRAGGTIA